MPGLSDYFAKNQLSYLAGETAFPSLPAIYLALFTAAPSDAGSGGTEVSGGSYARLQIAGEVTTNASTSTSSNVLNFSSVPSWVTIGMTARDTTSSSITGGQTVTAVSSTTVTLSANVNATVNSGDAIVFSAFGSASASSGSEPATSPANIINVCALAFAKATANWGTVVFFGFYDALTSGNFLAGDYLGNYSWNPFTGTNASPSVLTSPAHGYSNGDPVVVSQKYGGTLPSTGGSWSGILTVAGETTDTFNVSVNTTGTGNGMVRKILEQSVPTGVLASFASGALTILGA